MANEYLYSKLTVNGKVLSDNALFFLKHGELNFPRSKLDVKVTERNVDDFGEYRRKVSCLASLYTRLVELRVLPVVLNRTPLYSDNFFDIQANETKEVEIRGRLLKG